MVCGGATGNLGRIHGVPELSGVWAGLGVLFRTSLTCNVRDWMGVGTKHDLTYHQLLKQLFALFGYLMD